MDVQDRYWFGEYTGDRVGMFDTRTETFQEWPFRPYSQPYTSTTPDPKGYVYAPSNMSERLMRLNPATGEVVEYLMPGNFDAKKIAYDPTASRVVMWMANTRNARMLRVEPLD
jgi:streptogramin lyase